MEVENIEANPQITSGKHVSYWVETASSPQLNPLKENLDTDVVIVGGGLAGLSTAYCLLKSGKKVIVVEDGSIGSGETGRTTAHLVTALDDRYYEFIRIFGEEKTKLIAESHRAAIEFVERTAKEENIDCEFERVNGYLFLHPTDKPDSLEKEYEAAKKAGVDVEKVRDIPGLSSQKEAIRFLNQAQFHPMKYLEGLAKAIEQKGGKIFTGTHASEIDHKGIKTTDGFTVTAKHIVVATNTPVNNLFVICEKQYAYRTYVIGSLIKKNSISKALWWDTGNMEEDPKVPPYHYVRLAPYNDQYDLLISGGEDHPTGDTSKTKVPEESRYRHLEHWTREHFPIGETIFRWSGQVMEPMDGLAFIGHNPLDHDNVYIVTGDSGNGMTHCSFAGLLLTDLINGRENKWKEIYKPWRFTISESGPVFKQMMHEFVSYLKQWPNLNSASELADVKNGEGKIVNMLEEKFGVYRDPNGLLHIVGAQCTHLKCTIAWNRDEKSWDCPCHGSRFTYDGKVMNGPANFDLHTYSESGERTDKDKN